MTVYRRALSSAGWLLCLAAVVTSTPGAVSAQSRQFVPRGSIPTPPGFALQYGLVKLDGTRAYVSSASTLTIFDVSDPAAPTRLGAYEFSHQIWGFRVVGSSVYVGADAFGLGILEISDAGVPRLVGSFTLGQAKNVAVSGTTALVADYLEGVVILDISTPSNPVRVASVFVEGVASDVVISGSLTYAVDRPMGLYLLDISNPDAADATVVPQSTSMGDFVAQLELVHPEPGPPLVVVVSNGLLQPFDISDPRAPVQLSTYRTPGGVQRATFAGSLAYVADGQDGLVVLDLSTPDNPRVVGTYKTDTPTIDVAVGNSLVLLAMEGEILILEQPR